MNPRFASVALLSTTLLAGAASAATRVVERDLSSLLVHCDKPIASVSLGDFTCKAAACQTTPAAGPASGAAALLQLAQAAQGINTQQFPALGSTMGSGLTTALKATGCFVVQEREALEALQREAALTGVELKPQAADYLISGAITSINVSTRSTSLGGGYLPVIGAVSKNTRSASLGIDVRLIDVNRQPALQLGCGRGRLCRRGRPLRRRAYDRFSRAGFGGQRGHHQRRQLHRRGARRRGHRSAAAADELTHILTR